MEDVDDELEVQVEVDGTASDEEEEQEMVEEERNIRCPAFPFDEVYFGKFASKYIKTQYFVDYDGQFDFKDIGKIYEHVPYVAMRMVPALLGVATVPLSCPTLRALDCRATTALLASLFITFENGLITQSRHIPLDSPLVFFTALTVFLWCGFCNEDKHRPFSSSWWTWLTLSGLSLGAVVSCKWVGLFTIATIGLSTLVQLWTMLVTMTGKSSTPVWTALPLTTSSAPFMGIKLRHTVTEKHLNSHDHRPLVSEVDFQNEVSAYGQQSRVMSSRRSERRNGRETEAVSQSQHMQVPMSMEHAMSIGLGMGYSTSIPVSATSTTSQDVSVEIIEPPPSTARTKAVLAAEAPYLSLYWLEFTRTRSAQFIADKTCEMICYLWFASPSKRRDAELGEDDKDRKSESTVAAPNTPPSTIRPAPTTLQLVAQPNCVLFMQKLLETTQVSQSVIVLSLHYIYRLKEWNRFTPAQPGSEFRIAVAGLMMGNKFLDDNTYTNKTWSEHTYASWLNLLKGLVLAKEKDGRAWRGRRAAGSAVNGSPMKDRHSRARERERDRERTNGAPAATTTNGYAYPSSNNYSSQAYTSRRRARSSSPTAGRSSASINVVTPSTNNSAAPTPAPSRHVHATHHALPPIITNTSATTFYPPMNAGTTTTTTGTMSAYTSPAVVYSQVPRPALPQFPCTQPPAASSGYASQPPPATASYSQAVPQPQTIPPRPGSKRIADLAFYPTSAAVGAG
ncbi:hypothetical protein CVT24_012310 [Panaeolus cyanescens]|uniref:ArnT-like N-terminal domain-containing protein n=1 Tax=Panaeolus cyanescens TaxID=181874 RepID=A0A409W487_9AGAR|nr:hypothetical protein CVT24_012310 [Panaeolus cyanescens]